MNTRKRAFSITIALVALMGATLACLSFGGGGGDVVEPEDSGGVVSDPAAIDILIENATGQDVCYLLISPVEDDTWNEDWLGDTEILGPNDSKLIDIGVAGNYDMMWLDCDQNTIGEVYNLYIGGGTSYALTDN